MKINKYPDGTSYAEVENDLNLLQMEEGYAFTHRINTYEDLWHLGQILEIMNWKGCAPIVNIPNLLDAQADRRFTSNQSFGLKMVCDFLNKYDAHFQIFHPHNPGIVEVLIDNVEVYGNDGFIKKVLKKLNQYTNISADIMPFYVFKDSNELVTLMSSDAGGFKPLIKLAESLEWQGETYSASKARDPKTGELTQLVDRQDFQGKDILIIDDISVYGGTFKGLSKLLRERNCGKLYLAVSHMTVQNLGEDPVTNYFDKVFTTNSKFDSYFTSYKGKTGGGVIMQPENLEIIKLF